MALAQIEFIVENSRHKVELDKQPPSSGYTVTVDGKIHSIIPANGLGFKTRFALFDGFCTVSGITLGWLCTSDRILMKQTSTTPAAR